MPVYIERFPLSGIRLILWPGLCADFQNVEIRYPVVGSRKMDIVQDYTLGYAATAMLLGIQVFKNFTVNT